jgi:hypothetical protein
MRSERSFVAFLANEFAIFSNRETQGFYVCFFSWQWSFFPLGCGSDSFFRLLVRLQHIFLLLTATLLAGLSNSSPLSNAV